MIENEQDWYWDWIKHEGNIFTARGNFFLVAESMFLVVVATLASIYEKHVTLLVYTCSGGIFITLIWLYVNGKHSHLQGIIVNKLKEIYNPYKDVKKLSKHCPWCIANHTMMGIFLPIGLLVLWVALLTYFLLAA